MFHWGKVSSATKRFLPAHFLLIAHTSFNSDWHENFVENIWSGLASENRLKRLIFFTSFHFIA